MTELTRLVVLSCHAQLDVQRRQGSHNHWLQFREAKPASHPMLEKMGSNKGQESDTKTEKKYDKLSDNTDLEGMIYMKDLF